MENENKPGLNLFGKFLMFFIGFGIIHWLNNQKRKQLEAMTPAELAEYTAAHQKKADGIWWLFKIYLIGMFIVLIICLILYHPANP